MRRTLTLLLAAAILLGAFSSCDDVVSEQSSSSAESQVEQSSSSVESSSNNTVSSTTPDTEAPSNTPQYTRNFDAPVVVIDGKTIKNIKDVEVVDGIVSLPLIDILKSAGITVEWLNDRIALVTRTASRQWVFDLNEPYFVPKGSNNSEKDNAIKSSDGEYRIVEKDIYISLTAMHGILQKVFYGNSPSISFNEENYIIDININHSSDEIGSTIPVYELSEDGTYYTVVGVVPRSSASYYDVMIHPTYNGLPVRKIESLERYQNYEDGELWSEDEEEILYYYYSVTVKINSLKIPYSVMEISEDAFDGQYIREFDVDVYNTSFKNYDGALYSYDGKKLLKQANDDSLREITVLEGTEIICNGAFRNMENIVTVRLPSTLLSIGEKAFYNCHRLVEIYNLSQIDIQKGSDENGIIAKNAIEIYTSSEIPSAVRVVDKDFIFFENDKETVLVNYIGGDRIVTLPSGKEYKIGTNAFRNKTGIIQINLSKSITSVRANAFTGMTNLYRVNVSDIEDFIAITFLSNPIREGVLLCVDGKAAKSITITNDVKMNTFENCESIEEVIITEGVSRIGEYAFKGCTSLERVVMANTVVEIGSYAFAECVSLKEIELSPSLKSISSFCFLNCDSLTKVIIPRSVDRIKSHAFYDCDFLTVVQLHENLDYVESKAFAECDSLRVIHIPPGLGKAEDAFYGVSTITRYHFD